MVVVLYFLQEGAGVSEFLELQVGLGHEEQAANRPFLKLLLLTLNQHLFQSNEGLFYH